MKLLATDVIIGMVLARETQRSRAQQSSVSWAAVCSYESPREVCDSQPRSPEAHSLVEHMLDGLRATCSIGSQRLVAKWWSAGLTSQPTCTAEESIRMARHPLQTA